MTVLKSRQLENPERIAPVLLLAGLLLFLWTAQSTAETDGQKGQLPNLETVAATIERLESSQGAYSPVLAELSVSLGKVLHQNQDYTGAISAFKRSVFLIRVNDGLNNPLQIPILKSLVTSHIAAGQFVEADERQSYLYRIQSINYQQNPERSLQAMLDFAEWQRKAYLLNLGKRSGQRLLMMHDFYQHAIQMLISSGETESKAIIAPLEGLMSAQYLLSVYQDRQPEAFQISAKTAAGNEFTSPLDNHMEFLHSSAFKQGNVILSRLHSLHVNDIDRSALAPVEYSIASADWHLWYNKRSAAMNLYREAYQELLKLEDADLHIHRLFGSPVSLPTTESTGSKLLTHKGRKKDDSGRFLVSYNISKAGKPFKFELIQAEPEGKSRRRSKVLRELKSKRFRPKFENGEPVVTENIVEEYVY